MTSVILPWLNFHKQFLWRLVFKLQGFALLRIRQSEACLFQYPPIWDNSFFKSVRNSHLEGNIGMDIELLVCSVDSKSSHLPGPLKFSLGSFMFLNIIVFTNWVVPFRSFFFFFYSGFCHTLKWNSHGFTCVPHPNPPSHLPLHPLPLGLPSAPGLIACLMHPTWAGDLFHPR